MDIISKLRNLLRKIESSIQFKFALTYIAIILVVLTITNIYPILLAQNMVFESERNLLLNQANYISSALSTIDPLTQEGADTAIGLMGPMEITRLVITDSEMNVLHDSSGSFELDEVTCADIQSALDDNMDVFYSDFKENVFISHASVPIVSNHETIGCVHIHDEETQQGSVISNIQSTLLFISIVVFVLSVLISLMFSSVFAKRISSILRSIRTVRKGNYNHRISITGKDEFAQLANEFNSLTDRLEKNEEMRRRFVSDASHELRTPLASIKLLTDSIINTPGIDMETVTEFIEDIGSQADRMSRLSEKLLSLSRLDEQEKYTGVSVDCSSTVTKVMRELRVLAQTGSITLERYIEPSCMIYGNADELYQVAYNLIENAIKYNIKGGWVKVTVRKYDLRVKLIVEDSGQGIPEEDLDRIFDRFYRVDKHRSRAKGGSGIGLSIVSEGVHRYGGDISVENIPGAGARFTVTFMPPKAPGENVQYLTTERNNDE